MPGRWGQRVRTNRTGHAVAAEIAAIGLIRPRRVPVRVLLSIMRLHVVILSVVPLDAGAICRPWVLRQIELSVHVLDVPTITVQNRRRRRANAGNEIGISGPLHTLAAFRLGKGRVEKRTRVTHVLSVLL